MFKGDAFTGLYEVQKTLRFELVPIGLTQSYLENDWVIQKDKEVEENYGKIKAYFDLIHKEFVRQSLENAWLCQLDDFYEKYIELHNSLETRKDKNLAKQFEKVMKSLKKEFVSFFDAKWNEWKQKFSFLKKWWIDVLNEKEVLDLMAEFYPDEKELFDKFDKFFTYFSNFKESRKNFYADDGRAWAIATRAIDENLITFIKNIEDFKKLNSSFREFVNDNFSEEDKQIFEIDFYNNCLLQPWIDKYNKIVWWYSLENWEKVQWLNEKINNFKQNQNKSNSKDLKFPRMKLLYKQILGDKEKKVYIDEIRDDKNLIDLIDNSKRRNQIKIDNANDIINDFINNNAKFELDKIYLTRQSINTISSKYFSSWDYIRWYFWTGELQEFVSFYDLKETFWKIEYETLENIFKDCYVKGINTESQNNIVFETQGIYENFLNIFKFEFNQNISQISLLEWELDKIQNEDIKKNEKQVEVIKNYFDSVMSVYKMTKYFSLEKWKKRVELDTDNNFYNDFNEYLEGFEIWKDYNLVRNYITKKQVNTDKIKLNFDNSQFLTWWDKDKENERLGIILRREWKYYLWILKKWNTLNFGDYLQKEWEIFYEKMNYKQLNNVYRQLPRLLFPLTKKLNELKWDELKKYLSKYIQNFWYNEEIAQIKIEFDIFQESKEKWEKFDIDKLRKLIEYYKKWVLALYSDLYDLEFIKYKNYDDLSIFYSDVEKKMYNLNFTKIDKSLIDGKVKSWELYLFQIYNKDFSESKKEWSTENIHTKYFKLLFNEKNLQNLVVKLSWWADIFFRDKTENLKFKKDKNGQEILDHRRFSQDKIMFHISITLNANCWDKYWFNQYVNEYMNKERDIKIIWIDRWEKHLAYYCVIDKSWKIFNNEIWTLNELNWVNYLEKLEKIESSRKDSRISWWEIENIKELKNGYISQVINKLTELIVKYNAIIVFEDLNIWFKRWRQKIEKQIYQKLELALAKKLNYLTQKDKKDDEILWNLKALQLVPKVNDYQDIWNYKQSWIMFYVRANYTSVTCPNCWLRKNLYISNSATKENQKKSLNSIAIKYNDWKFSFSYEIDDKSWKQKQSLNKKKFIVYSDIERFVYSPLEKLTKVIDVNKKLLELFRDFNLSLDINKQIQEKDLDSVFFKSLTHLFNLILQLRNSDSKDNKDYISCPSCYYHSNNWLQWFEFNWDANWAYNIARKGIILLDRIRKNQEKPDLYVSDIDWDNFVQSNQFPNTIIPIQNIEKQVPLNIKI
ncbi:MAG: hypothetical protein ACD_3C00058G0015 [uncultured bacterium (gcode 4)]|uniref:Uncharacterized protein n=1 Tax=uncultured bacterium (gcode 4) TaxID=1234023 RepID=K2GDV2_9BACT|nr:MAG: hypothetical protein ACD_3C00058G0015 [uncultured bacterium (gcode 4)]